MSPALLLLAFLAAPAQTPDRVHLQDGTVVAGQVSAATLDAINVKTTAGEQKLDGKQVLSVEFGDKPEALRAAEALLQAQDFQNAVSSFDAAAGASGAWWVKPLAQLERAEALLAWSAVDKNRAAEAAEAYTQWLAANGNSVLEPRARLGLGQALAAAGKTEDASRQLEELASLAFQHNLGKQVELGARLERARVYLNAGQAQVAEARLNDLVPELQQALGSSPPRAVIAPLERLQVQAAIALGDAKVARNGDAAARPYWESLLGDAKADPEVHAAATIGLAKANRAEGKHREAQLLLARVVATLPPGETLARALFEMGDVSRELNNNPVPGTVYFRQLVADYPNSPWAAKARTELGG